MIAAVPIEDQSEPIYAALLTSLQKLTLLSSNRQQDVLFDLIDTIVELDEKVRDESAPEFVQQAIHAFEAMKVVLVHEIADYITRVNADVPADKILKFFNALVKGNIINSGDWEDLTIPVSSLDVFILDPQGVVTLFQAEPWPLGEEYVGNETAEQAFANFADAGVRLQAVKDKYAVDQTLIHAKWKYPSNQAPYGIAMKRVSLGS